MVDHLKIDYKIIQNKEEEKAINILFQSNEKNLQIYMIIITSNQLYDGKPYIITKNLLKKHAIDHYYCTISSLTYNKIQLDIQILYVNNHIYIYPIQI